MLRDVYTCFNQVSRHLKNYGNLDKKEVVIMNNCIFVTCGATVPFPGLIDCIVDDNFITCAVESGYSRVIVQIGKGYTTELQRKFRKFDILDDYKCTLTAKSLGCDTIAASCRLKGCNLEYIAIEYSSKIEQIISTLSDIVISHAGTGSILDSLRLHKPLIVCVNDKLMDNHQEQIADKFEDLGYVLSCKPIPTDLINCVKMLPNSDLKPLPEPHNKNFEYAIVKTGFSL